MYTFDFIKNVNMPLVSIIVAVDTNHAIGKDNQLLCHLPNDLKHFKSITQGHTVIMGRKTFESLPNGALPNRRNIVLSRNNKSKIEGCEMFNDIHKAIHECSNDDEIFVIGGAELYKKTIGITNKLYITHIDQAFEGADSFFPLIDLNLWTQTERIDNTSDDKNLYAHSFITYIRK
ncbi:MAG: hypothetical protein RL662_508 [Bacteroidota bacterium]|jgi:dihydrofolate reductase